MGSIVFSFSLFKVRRAKLSPGVYLLVCVLFLLLFLFSSHAQLSFFSHHQFNHILFKSLVQPQSYNIQSTAA